MPTITPFLWFDGQAEAASAFYRSVFADTKAGAVVRAGPGADAPVFTAAFELEGQPFIALNGGPHFTFNEAVSFLVSCADQAEADDLWDKLVAGGTPSRCGWLKDRFGLSWQIVPSGLRDLMGDPDPVRAARVRDTLMGMTRIDLAALRAARDGGPRGE